MTQANTTDANPTPTTALLALLAPLLARVAALQPERCATPEQVGALEAALEREFPHASAEVQTLGRLLAQGVDEGWLADRGSADAKFSRVAKPSPTTHDLSVDLVSMLGAGVEHSHPRGEVTLGFPADLAAATANSCHFEGRPPGWVVLAPRSRHVPTVTGARMNLIYFLPGGAVEWHI